MTRPAEQTGLAVRDAPQPPATHGVFRIVWQRKYLVALGPVVGILVGSLYYAKAPPVYQSAAKVLVVKKKPDAAVPGMDWSFSPTEDYLATHQSLIRSPLIVGQAVQRGSLRTLQTFAGMEDPAATIIDGLKVSRETNGSSPTNILTLSFRGPVPGDCKAVLNAVIDSYKNFLETTYRNVSDETVKLITQAREVMETKLARKEEEYRNYCLKQPFLSKGKDGTNVQQERIFKVEAKRSGLLLRATEIQGRLTALEKALKEGRPQSGQTH